MSSSMSSADAFALQALDKVWQFIRVFTIIVGGAALILTDMYAGGAYYDSIFNFTFGPPFVSMYGPWLISVGTSAAQIWMFQYLMVFKRENLPKRPMEYIAIVGIVLLTIIDTAADAGGATQLMYGDQYVPNIIPSGLVPSDVVGIGVIVLISLLADPLVGYFVSNKKPSNSAMFGD